MEVSRESVREDFKKFRSEFKEESLSLAEKSVRLEKRGAVGMIVFDAANSKANTLGTPVMLRLFELLSEIEKDKEIAAVVIISRKPTIFIAGADISEIQSLTTGGMPVDTLMKLQSIFTFLEKLPIPSIAAIHGACMGGGCELALACDYRIVTDARETRIGLPEVQLGVLPGWGGTQRMPRLIGLENSLDLILSGRAVDGKTAKRMGLADKLVPKEILEEKALAWAESLAVSRAKRPPRQTDLKGKLLESNPLGKWVVFDMARKKVLERTKGHYPAPLKALEVLKETSGMELEQGLRKEAEAFGELVKSSECKNLVQLFFLNDKIKKDKGVEGGGRGIDVQQAGVLGAGIMGGGIAQLFAQNKIRVRMKDINWDAIAKGYAAASKIFKKAVERRKMKPFEYANAMALVEGTTSYAGFKQLDLVVEAVVEDLEIKKKVFAELEKNTGPKTILATNTSSLSVTAMASACQDPKRVVGMHFFNPVDKMPLVEVIRGKETSDEAVATVFQLSKRLGKTPIVVGDAPGFVVNRILGPYLNEAVYLMIEGAKPTEIDRVMEKFGMPMGPCTLLDEIGLDVASKVCKVLYGAFGDRMKPPASFDLFVKEGRLGKKTMKGIYLYEKGVKKGIEDAALLTKLKPSARDAALTDSVIEKRLLYLMVNEAARVIEEKLVRDVSDIDVGMIFGTGFAPFRGGLLRWADTVGADTIATELDLYTRKYGPRFQTCAFLQQLAVSKGKFYSA